MLIPRPNEDVIELYSSYFTVCPKSSSEFFFLNGLIIVNSLKCCLFLNESVDNGLSKTGLSLKIGQAVPKLWNKCQILHKCFLLGRNDKKIFFANQKSQ